MVLQVHRGAAGRSQGWSRGLDCKGGRVEKVSKGFTGRVLSALKGLCHSDLLTTKPFWPWWVNGGLERMCEAVARTWRGGNLLNIL